VVPNHGGAVATGGVADGVGDSFIGCERITVSKRAAYVARTIVRATRAAVKTPVIIANALIHLESASSR